MPLRAGAGRMEVHLNLGCGSVTPAGWINVDYSLGSRLGRIPALGWLVRKLKLFRIEWNPQIVVLDLRKPFRWEEGSVDAIYCSHFLEHLRKPEGERFLKECHRVLREGGVLRILVPDLRKIVDEYIEGGCGAPEFLDRLGVLYDKKKTLFGFDLSMLVEFPHRCMYDQESLRKGMEDAGFSAEAKGAFESRIAGIDSVERRDRTEGAVIVEGIKSLRP